MNMDQPEKAKKLVRTYDCTFCNRGFTKAQALGGHMNIHSKKRAKPKTVTSLQAKNDSEYYNSNNLANNCKFSTIPISSENCLVPRRVNYLMHLPTKEYPSFSRRSFAGENFRLRIGPTVVDVDGDDDQERNEVVDVELRLGFNP